MPFDMRPDHVGWTVFDVSTGSAVLLDDVELVGLEANSPAVPFMDVGFVEVRNRH